MDSLENELRTGIGLIEEKIKRVETITQIMDSILNITLERKSLSDVHDLEEYYVYQINKWIISCANKMKELEEKEDLLQETQKKYLVSLRRIKELEDRIQNIEEKYLHYKHTEQKKEEK